MPCYRVKLPNGTVALVKMASRQVGSMLQHTFHRACVHCGGTLNYKLGLGWCHAEGGDLMMRCTNCGWEAAPPALAVACPDCGRVGLIYDHYARPAR